ncbi:hypothetical protein HRED_07594 [Candidatus Haloredivivus sp. G17]|nr:hypothetical protein HRED_07594 [Candidatus Haloredivivus sp. G17]
MSLEAWSGKNPVTHVGKINQIRAHELSEKIHEETGKFAQCRIINKIGRPELIIFEVKVRKILASSSCISLTKSIASLRCEA